MNRYMSLLGMVVVVTGLAQAAERVSPIACQKRLKKIEERLHILGKNYVKVTDLDKADNRQKLDRELETLQAEKKQLMAKLAAALDESQIEVGFYYDKTKIPVNEKAQTLLTMFDITEYPPDEISMRQQQELFEQATASSEASSPTQSDSTVDDEDPEFAQDDLEFAQESNGTKQELVQKQRNLFHSIVATGSPVIPSKPKKIRQPLRKIEHVQEDDDLMFHIEGLPSVQHKKQVTKKITKKPGKTSPITPIHVATLYRKARFGSSL